jgi:hypothetical protein
MFASTDTYKGTKSQAIPEDLKERCTYPQRGTRYLQLTWCRSFMNVISELDHPIITEEWIRLTTQKGRRSFALRLRNPWIDEATGSPRQKWILCSCGKHIPRQVFYSFYEIYFKTIQGRFVKCVLGAKTAFSPCILQALLDFTMLICWADQEFDEEGRIKTIMGCM